ncbi:MAG: A/G-specific adenine glycosylase [candidate division KSB1 bacterium]|nr:A/G-specific adenine glycosylase [candidate division KSB1 bacterium]
MRGVKKDAIQPKIIDRISSRRRWHLQRRVLNWYLNNHRDLPWRRTRDPYRIWISEVMLQQTQTIKVLEYYENFLNHFPDVATLAGAELDEVLKAWEGMGYYARARNLHRAANYITQYCRGRLPRSYEKLLAIPGIGPYTAAALLSIAFNQDYAVVDGNVERVLCRWFAIKKSPQATPIKKMLRDLAQGVLRRGQARFWNQAMMELGARICTPRHPKCKACPAVRYCRAAQELEDPAQLPVRRRRNKLPSHQIVAGLIWRDGKLLIDQRKNDGLLGGLWEFPGGKIKNGESHAQALRREIREALDVEAEVGDYVMSVDHAYTHFRVTLHVYQCIYRRGQPRALACQNWRWAHPTELAQLAFPKANRKIIDRLLVEVI